MKQATALYPAMEASEEQAISTGIEKMLDDLPLLDPDLREWLEIAQVTTTGNPGGYSVEFTFLFPEEREIDFENAETYEVLE